MNNFNILKLNKFILATLGVVVVALLAFKPGAPSKLSIKKGSHITLVGNNLGSRMMNFGYFETELQPRYPDHELYVRNMCDGGNTPGFRPHSGRPTPWAFPGAEKFQTELANDPKTEGFLAYPDEWITTHIADIVIAMFGFDESFQGPAGVENYKAELDAFIKHTLAQKYNGDLYEFGLIRVISAGVRDADAEGVEGMSASKMRKAVVDNDFDSFRRGTPKTLDDGDTQALFDAVRQGMGVKKKKKNAVS